MVDDTVGKIRVHQTTWRWEDTEERSAAAHLVDAGRIDQLRSGGVLFHS
jgi:hypothetical protein